MPALLTSTSSRPKVSIAAATKPPSTVEVADVVVVGDRLDHPISLNLRHHLVGRRRVGALDRRAPHRRR